MSYDPNKKPINQSRLDEFTMSDDQVVKLVNEIMVGNANIVIAGGLENTSDTPIGFPKKMRNKLFSAQKIKSLRDSLKFPPIISENSMREGTTSSQLFL